MPIFWGNSVTDQTTAWRLQAQSDFVCATAILKLDQATTYCHAIAKYQQAIEKSIKAVISKKGGNIGKNHAVRKHVDGLLRVTRPSHGALGIDKSLHKIFAPEILRGIAEIDQLAPKYPTVGQPFPRNTEYPFEINGGWTYPAANGSFSRAETEKFRNVAYQVVESCAR